MQDSAMLQVHQTDANGQCAGEPVDAGFCDASGTPADANGQCAGEPVDAGFCDASGTPADANGQCAGEPVDAGFCDASGTPADANGQCAGEPVDAGFCEGGADPNSEGLCEVLEEPDDCPAPATFNEGQGICVWRAEDAPCDTYGGTPAGINCRVDPEFQCWGPPVGTCIVESTIDPAFCDASGTPD